MIKVGISGLGLIGASILKKLSKIEGYEVFCQSNSSFEKAKKYTCHASIDIEILASCDIIFICSNADETLLYLDKINNIPNLNKDVIVADVSSIKKELLNKADKKYKFNFILSHPMAGSEKSGFDASKEDLFVGSRWLIEKNSPLLEKVINDLGAKPILVDMERHDKLLSYVSHLPTILSFLLFDISPDESKKLASSGFRDTTRLAATNDNLAYNMFFQNEDNILKAFEELIKKMDDLKNMPESEKIKLFKQIREKRMKMYDENGKNIF